MTMNIYPCNTREQLSLAMIYINLDIKKQSDAAGFFSFFSLPDRQLTMHAAVLNLNCNS